MILYVCKYGSRPFVGVVVVWLKGKPTSKFGRPAGRPAGRRPAGRLQILMWALIARSLGTKTNGTPPYQYGNFDRRA